MSSTTFIRKKEVRVAEIAQNTQIWQSRTRDRLKFEVEYSRPKGTTSNSYLIQGDKTALIDPPGKVFTQIYLETLADRKLSKLDYIIVQHANPNRLATVQILAGYAPNATIICTELAAQSLKGALIFPQWKSRVRVVKDGDILDLGKGHRLQFVDASTPRWIDGLCTYDPQTQILYTDKIFGFHGCNYTIGDRDERKLHLDRRFYFDCLHAVQTKSITSILERLESFPSKIYAPAHGGSIVHNPSQLSNDYRQWCAAQNSRDFKVILFCSAAYGSTAILANAIARGLIQTGVSVELIDPQQISTPEIIQSIRACDGLIIGSSVLGGCLSREIQTTVEVILANADKIKLAGVFGYYSWNKQPLDWLASQLETVELDFGFEPIYIHFSPSMKTLNRCIQAGKKFAAKLQEAKHKKNIERQDIESALFLSL